MTNELQPEVQRLLGFLARQPLTAAVGRLEHALDGASGQEADEQARAFGIDEELLDAAVATRRQLGRLNDLIHASAIVLMLPRLLEDGEVVRGRPSLAAGNDSSRPYDLETNRRIAEFKLAQWAGADAMRKRGVFKDLVHLAADLSGRRAQLFVVGPAPIKFLQSSKSVAAWGLDRATTTRQLFVERFGSLSMPIREFTAGPGAHVELVDLAPQFPSLV